MHRDIPIPLGAFLLALDDIVLHTARSDVLSLGLAITSL